MCGKSLDACQARAGHWAFGFWHALLISPEGHVGQACSDAIEIGTSSYQAGFCADNVPCTVLYHRLKLLRDGAKGTPSILNLPMPP